MRIIIPGLTKARVLPPTIRATARVSSISARITLQSRGIFIKSLPQKPCFNICAVRFASTTTTTAKIPELQWAQVLEQKGGRKFTFFSSHLVCVRQNKNTICIGYLLTRHTKAVIYKKIPVPKPGPDEVLINVKYSGVCHTDLHAVNGDWPLPSKMPLIGGHEGAGVVVARGELVKDIELGDHAGIKVCTQVILFSFFSLFFLFLP